MGNSNKIRVKERGAQTHRQRVRETYGKHNRPTDKKKDKANDTRRINQLVNKQINNKLLRKTNIRY